MAPALLLFNSIYKRACSEPKHSSFTEESSPTKLEDEARRVLQRRIEYEALSWCWGDGEDLYAIRIERNGDVFKRKIRMELALALRYLRYPDKKRTIWVDSICIDQDNHSERNHQVQMMSRIYTRADRVCVWLGTADNDTDAAIDFIKKEVLELKNFDTVCSDKKYATKWRALMILMQRPWFSRRWMIQEISLAQTATIHCGPATIDWTDFAVAVELFVEVENASHRLSEIMQKDEKFLHIPGWFEHISELGASLLVQATGKVFRTQRMGTEARLLLNQSNNPMEFAVDEEAPKKEVLEKAAKQVAKGHHAIDPLERRSLLSLQYLVTTMYIFQTSEPRDVIYSLLAVARDASPSAEDSVLSDPTTALLMRTGFSSFLEAKPFKVDYARAYSDVCRDFVQFSIERACQVDPVQALNILCRPWALEPPKQKSARLDKGPKTNKPKGPIKPLRHNWTIGKAKTQDGRNMNVYFAECDQKRKDGGFKLRLRTAVKLEPIKPEPVEIETVQHGRLYIFLSWIHTIIANLAIMWFVRPRIREDVPEDVLKMCRSIKDMHFTQRKLQDGAPEVDDIPRPSWVASVNAAPFGLFHHPGAIEKTGRINADSLVGPPEE